MHLLEKTQAQDTAKHSMKANDEVQRKLDVLLQKDGNIFLNKNNSNNHSRNYKGSDTPSTFRRAVN